MPRYKNSRLWTGIGLLVTDSLFFGLSDPSKVSAYALIAAVLLLAATVYWTIGGILAILQWYGLTVGRHRRRLSMSLTCLVAGLAALQSVSQLSLHDVMVLVPLSLLAYLYLSYNRIQQEQAG